MSKKINAEQLLGQGKAEKSGKCQVLGMQDWARNKTAEKSISVQI